MPTVPPWVATIPDRHVRRGVWGLALFLIVAAAFVYAGKAADDRSAFVRWRPQVRMFWMEGVNIYDKQMFPNPPIMPLTLLPLMLLPTVVGAMAWFALKAGLAGASARMCFRMAEEEPGRQISPWAEGLILLFSLRPVLSDLHHGNNNLLILFLVVSALYAWRRGYDVLAGLALALAISYKVTPALFVPYFLYKRSWRMVGATGLGIGVFLLIVPGLILGPEFNGRCLAMWWHRIVRPFVANGEIGDMEINQSLVGVLSRLLTVPKEVQFVTEADLRGAGRYTRGLGLAAWDPRMVAWLIKGISLGLVGLLAFLCRTRTNRRDDARLLGEFSLVVLTMLFVSERSWKHHYVTLLLPYAYLVGRMCRRGITWRTRLILVAALDLSALLILSTSSEVGSHLAGKEGHKLALFYGMFLWAGVVLYVATAWRVRAERLEVPEPPGRDVPAPHFAAVPSQAALE